MIWQQPLTRTRCLSIARSHSIAGNQLNALALTKQAFDKSELVTRAIKATKSDGSPTNIQVYRSDVENLHDTLRRELERYRALVDLEKLQKKATADGSADSKAPLIDHLQEYPVGGVDLNNIVIYPPKFEPVPAKPIFLDVAWNYIEYPDRMAKEEPKKGAAAEKTEPAAPAQPQRKGWFSFGR